METKNRSNVFFFLIRLTRTWLQYHRWTAGGAARPHPGGSSGAAAEPRGSFHSPEAAVGGFCSLRTPSSCLLENCEYFCLFINTFGPARLSEAGSGRRTGRAGRFSPGYPTFVPGFQLETRAKNQASQLGYLASQVAVRTGAFLLAFSPFAASCLGQEHRVWSLPPAPGRRLC